MKLVPSNGNGLATNDWSNLNSEEKYRYLNVFGFYGVGKNQNSKSVQVESRTQPVSNKFLKAFCNIVLKRNIARIIYFLLKDSSSLSYIINLKYADAFTKLLTIILEVISPLNINQVAPATIYYFFKQIPFNRRLRAPKAELFVQCGVSSSRYFKLLFKSAS